MRISDWSSDVCSSDLVVTGTSAGKRESRPADSCGWHMSGNRKRTGRHRPLQECQSSGANETRTESPRRPTACGRSEEHTSELQLLMRTPYAVFCLEKQQAMRRRTQEEYATEHKQPNTN